MVGQPVIVCLDAFVLPHLVFAWFVECLNTQHNEARIVSSSQADVVQVVKSNTELRANERICWWFELSSHTEWLETEDACQNEVYIVSPSSNDRVSLDSSTRDIL